MKTSKEPKEWVNKTARTIRRIGKRMGKRISVKSSKIMAKDTWKHGLKVKCRIKAIKKYKQR